MEWDLDLVLTVVLLDDLGLPPKAPEPATSLPT